MRAMKDDIKSTVTMNDVLSLYGILYHGGRIKCPIHNSNHNNFGIKNNIYTCFSRCGSGDIFRFVMLMENCDFPTALNHICEQFNIPNDNTETPEQRQEFDNCLQERQKQAQEQRELDTRARYVYSRLAAYNWFMRDNREAYAPCSDDDEWHPLFCEALRNGEIVESMLDEFLSDMAGLVELVPDVEGWLREIRH